MEREIRFGDFVREVSARHHEISYSELSPPIERDAQGNPLPCRPEQHRLRRMEIYRLLAPYVGVRFIDQVKAVVPLAVYLVLFPVLIRRQVVSDAWLITGGFMAVILGLMLFMEGLKVGLMPFGETIGNTLPRKRSLPVVLLIAFLLGVGVTFAEPAIGALRAAGATVQVEKAPYLYALLNQYTDSLVLVVGTGVGLAAVIGTLRFLYGWSLKPLIAASLVPTVGFTIYAMLGDDLSSVIGLAWDCGAVTTGPVTVPLVLALGIGVAAAGGKGGAGSSSISGFGIVTLASLFPILGVLCLATWVAAAVTPEEIIAAANAAAGATGPAWHEQTPAVEVVGGLRAIVPLMLFLYFVMRVVLRERIRDGRIVLYGVALAVLGMIVFNLGLTYGLAKLGDQSGGLVPGAFAAIESVAASPLYGVGIGIAIAVGFALVLGFGATLAEPALNALGMTVEKLTNGAFRKSLLMYAVSFGVALGIAVGVLKFIYDIPLAWLVLPGYILAIVLTALSSEEFVNVAWDSAGVTTGPVTVPLVLAMGLGFGGAVHAVDGFGILAMASIGPIISVMTCGLWVEWRLKREVQAAQVAKEDLEVALP